MDSPAVDRDIVVGEFGDPAGLQIVVALHMAAHPAEAAVHRPATHWVSSPSRSKRLLAVSWSFLATVSTSPLRIVNPSRATNSIRPKGSPASGTFSSGSKRVSGL